MDVIRFLRRHWVMILAFAVVAATVTALVISLLIPPRYEAAATLVIIPVTFKSQLKPPALPVQGYQRLLESNAVIAETARRLVADGTLEEGSELKLDDDIKTRIFVSRRAEETTLAPMIEAVAYGESGEQAASIANTWVEVFLERSRMITDVGLSSTIQLVEGQYETEQEQLGQLEEQLATTANRYQVQIGDVALTWDSRLLRAKKETEDLIAAYHTETRQLMQQLASGFGLEVAGTETVFGDGPGAVEGGADLTRPRLSGDLEKRLSQVLALRVQLAQTPRVLVLEKAVSDDVLWQAIALSQANVMDLESVTNQKILSQESNSVYTELATRLSQIEGDLEATDEGERQVIQSLAASLEKLQRQRSAGLTKLLGERALATNALANRREQAITALDRERETVMAQLSRAIQHKKNLYSTLAQNYNEATLAKAESTSEDLRIAAPAVASQPVEPRLLLKSLLAAFLGGTLGLFIALVRDLGAQ